MDVTSKLTKFRVTILNISKCLLVSSYFHWFVNLPLISIGVGDAIDSDRKLAQFPIQDVSKAYS